MHKVITPLSKLKVAEASESSMQKFKDSYHMDPYREWNFNGHPHDTFAVNFLVRNAWLCFWC